MDCAAGPALWAAEERTEPDAVGWRTVIWKSSGAPNLGRELLIRAGTQVSPHTPCTKPTPTQGFTDTLASAPPTPPLLLGSRPQDAVCFAWEPGIKKT